MAGELYLKKGTAKKVNGEADADVAWSMEGVANAAGRVSAQIDWGAAPRPCMYEWSCSVQWQATPSQYGQLELYVAGAPDTASTRIDGDIGASDAALGDPDMRTNLRSIGTVVSENAAASEACVASGTFTFTQRYMSLVGYNNAGATINATDSNFVFTIVPVYMQAQ